MRIALIHAMAASVPPIETAFGRLWPDVALVNLLDDSLAADLLRDGGSLGQSMTDRFLALARYAHRAGADGILFTCSAFGPCIEACAAALPSIPVLKPNEAMIEDIVSVGGAAGHVGLIASFEPSLATMPPEFLTAAPGLTVTPHLAEGALAALNAGNGEDHDAAVVRAAAELADCDVIALAQFSLARAAAAVAAATGKPVFTTPDSAVGKLRRLLAPAEAA